MMPLAAWAGALTAPPWATPTRAERLVAPRQIVAGQDERHRAFGRRALAHGLRVAPGKAGRVVEQDIGARCRPRRTRQASPSATGWLVDQPAELRRRGRGVARQHFDAQDALCPVGMALPGRNPDRVAGQVLAGEDADAAGRLVERPAEDVELRLADAAARQLDRPAEMHRPIGVRGRAPALP